MILKINSRCWRTKAYFLSRNEIFVFKSPMQLTSVYSIKKDIQFLIILFLQYNMLYVKTLRHILWYAVR